MNSKIKQIYELDQRKLAICNALKEHGKLGLADISKYSNLDISICRRASVSLEMAGYLHCERKFTNNKKTLYYYLAGVEFVAKTVEESEEAFKLAMADRHIKSSVGKYDNLILSNPNLKRYCLFETKDKDYFKQDYKHKVNRGISSHWSLFDAA
jgi:DNA-binding MarR family transcriptional regulator